MSQWFSKCLCFGLLFAPLQIDAQRHEISDNDLRSLQVIADNDFERLPITSLNGGRISIDFDDLTHTYRRLLYKLVYCDANWQPSIGIFNSEIAEGFLSDNTIDNVKESTLTNTLYTHYHLELPNAKCKPKLSGNYKLIVYDDNNPDVPLLTACFMLVEPTGQTMGVRLGVTTQTDATINTAHQQVEMEVNYGGYSVSNPNNQIKTVVLQNRDWLYARFNSKPQYVLPDGLRWTHNQDYIFNAGNEFRKFEILSTEVSSMGVDHIDWNGEHYNAYLIPTRPIENYSYDVDANGAFILRNSDNNEAETTSDYIWTHFTLEIDKPLPYRVFLDGDWTYHRLSKNVEMEYNETTRAYEVVVPLKLGYYNYGFVLTDYNEQLVNTTIDRNHYQTENTYQALVYYRALGGRNDRLVGYANYTDKRKGQ